VAVVKLTSKYRFTIPAEIRRNLDIRPGDQIEMKAFAHHIEAKVIYRHRKTCGPTRDRRSSRP
jgi:AbrB family looped-hinge helix DNA binding protein